MQSDAFSTFNRWLLFIGVLIAGLALAHHYDLIRTLIQSDASYLSAAILAFFFAATLNVGWLSWQLGKEVNKAAQLTQSARQSYSLFESAKGQVHFANDSTESSVAKEHITLLAEKVITCGALTGHEALLDRLDNKLRRGHETGWFIADLLVRLGLLGTVIGFILMLGSLSTVSSIDLQALQQLLTRMTEGMQIALYTTLSGLTAGILLSFQYQLLDQGANRLLADIIELSEVHVLRHLKALREINQ